MAPPKCLHRKRQFSTVFCYGVTADILRMYSSSKQKLLKSSSPLVILILVLFVGAETNTDVFGSIPSVSTDSYCTSPSVEQIKSKELGCVLISFY